MIVKGICIRNIYFMLSYAFKALRQGVYTRFHAEDFDHAEDLFAGILSLGIAHAVKRGLNRSYEDLSDDLCGVKGRIDLAGTIDHRVNRRLLLKCEFDEFTENNPFNRILKSTSLALLRTGRVKVCARELKRAILPLEAVDEIDIHHIRWSSLRYERNNQHYHMLMNVCHMIIDGLLMSEHTEEGRSGMTEFQLREDVFASLYENFLRGYFAVHYKLHSSAPHIAWDLGESDQSGLLPVMKSDVMLYDDNHVLIIDAKFYGKILQSFRDKKSVRNSHLYQIHSYVTNYAAVHGNDGKEVSGLLLYAETKEEGIMSSSWVIGGHVIGVDVLDLSQPFTSIANKLDDIVSGCFGVGLKID